MNQSTIDDLVTANTTNQEQTDRDATLAKFEIAILSVIFVLIVLGNGVVIIALIAARVKIQRMYYFLLHLSISDLVTAFLNVLPQLIWEITINFYGNNFLCKFVKCIQLLGPYLSSYVLVVTAIDRYQAICFPLANCTWTERRAKIMISIAWLISLICCLPQAFIFSYVQIATTTYPNKTTSYKVFKEPVLEIESNTKYYFECWGTFIQPYGEKFYVLWYAISVFGVPLVVLVFTYFNICKVIWINARLGQTSNKSKKSTTTTAAKNANRTLIFHSKLATSLSKQRSERRDDENRFSTSDGHLAKCRLSNETNKLNKCDFNTADQTNEAAANQTSFAMTSSKADCCRAQNGQTSTSMNNQIHSHHLLQTAANDKLPTVQTTTTTTTKSASSIFTSRTAAQSKSLSKAKIKTIKVTLVVIICYISCSLPFCSVQIWAQFWPNALTSEWTGS